ncbi:hypothetical protein DY467_20555 [Rhodopseudomonas sp. BR0G17]|nr:hypothetical protein [Rhodopseudomonas sp. BR0G17]
MQRPRGLVARKSQASKSQRRHCEERSDEAIQRHSALELDCFASLAMTNSGERTVRQAVWAL